MGYGGEEPAGQYEAHVKPMDVSGSGVVSMVTNHYTIAGVRGLDRTIPIGFIIGGPCKKTTEELFRNPVTFRNCTAILGILTKEGR